MTLNLQRIIKIAIFVMILLFPLPVHADKDGWPQSIRIGFVPAQGRETPDYHRPLTEHLKKSLGIEVTTVSGQDYDGVIKALAYQQIEFAYLGPKSYIEAKEQTGVEALVIELNRDKEPGYYSLIISKKDSGIDTIESAKGKGFAFTDPNSTSGYLVPSVMFDRDFHINPKTFFKSVVFSGSHSASILGVKNGTYEVAATSTMDFSKFREESKEVSEQDFNILKKSEMIPGSPVCVRKDLPESLKTAFRDAMISFGQTEAAKNTSVIGYVRADDKVFDVIRELERYRKQIKK